MNTRSFLPFTAPSGVIVDQELAFQEGSLTLKRPWQRWVGTLAMLAGMTVAMIIFWSAFAGALLQRDGSPVMDALKSGLLIFTIFTAIMHLVFLFQTLGLAGNSITRERQNGTWEPLLLTGMDTKQIIQGKWWATVRRQWRNYLKLAVLQVGEMGAASMIALIFARIFNTTSISEMVFPTIWQVLAAGLVVVALTLADLCFTAAWGVLASVGARRTATAVAWAIATRVLLMIVAGVLVAMITTRQVGVGFGLATLIDNGVMFGGDWASLRYAYQSSSHQTIQYVLVALVTLAAYAVVTRFVLVVAERRLTREMAQEPAKAA